jgi:lysylphosphatidylglycerol synthetase-like protein (DUF2156 family)
VTVIPKVTIKNVHKIAILANPTAFDLFVAIFFVFIGTYLLFISLSVLLIERLQKLPKFYYRPNLYVVTVIPKVTIKNVHKIAILANPTAFDFIRALNLLFISLSVLLIERLQKLPKFYYRPKRFFLISGLRARSLK